MNSLHFMKKLFGPGLSGLGIGSLSYLKTFGQDLQDFQDYFVYLWKAWKNIQSILRAEAKRSEDW